MYSICRCFLLIHATAIMFQKGQGNRYEESTYGESPFAEKHADLNLEDVVVDFLEKVRKEIGASLWDFDVTGQNANCPWEKYNRPHVKAVFTEVQLLGQLGIKSTKPVVAYTQLFHNGQPDRNETATIKKDTKRLNTESYTVERGITTGMAGTFHGEALGFLEVSTHISVTFSTVHGSTTLKSEEKTFSINMKVNIPPESTVRVDWIITEEIVDVPWEVYVDLKGYFAGQFEYKDGRKKWLFFDVTNLLGHPDLLRRDDGVYFQAKGFYKNIKAASNHVVTREKLHNPKYRSGRKTKKD